MDEHTRVVDAVGGLYVQLHALDEDLAGRAFDTLDQQAIDVAANAVVPQRATHHRVHLAADVLMPHLARLLALEVVE